MKVQVDPDKCQGHTLCAMLVPTVFELSDIDGHASVAVYEVSVDEQAGVLEAIASCPEQAISVL